MTRWSTTPKPHPKWSVADKFGRYNGEYDYEGAQKACVFLNEHGNHAPYRVIAVGQPRRVA